MEFTQKDSQQIVSHGSTTAKVEAQLENFRQGFGYLPVISAATIGNGIIAPDENARTAYIKVYEEASAGLKSVKFVPASGAATRMFKELFEYAAGGEKTKAIDKLLDGMDRFAFRERIKGNYAAGDDKAAVQAVLDYGAQLPKALILFHNYEHGPRTAFEEHLAEGAMYARSGDQVNIHFTISPEHREGFESLLAQVREKYEKEYGVKYDITFSTQDPGTDTVAVTPENELFREEDGSLLFRPAGHGALIGNLNGIDADVIFIKNIDNVTPDHLKADTVTYKKMIAGMLIDLQGRINSLLERLDAHTGKVEEPEADLLEEAEDFVRDTLYITMPGSYESLAPDAKVTELKRVLDRPVRVCGMVKNEGEPGGGPFFAANPDGSVSLQIAEPSQVAPEKRNLLKEGTHFNPVDLVCGVKNYRGEKFDLTKYTDPATGFISEKSKNGRPLKAQELPGLWNGAMSDWITVFAEVPVSTFTPVKEVTDLLRAEHQ